MWMKWLGEWKNSCLFKSGFLSVGLGHGQNLRHRESTHCIYRHTIISKLKLNHLQSGA